LIVTDVQNDFADPQGALYVPGADEILATLNREIDRAADAGSTVVYTQDWHPPVTPHFAKDGGTWPVHCVRQSWGAAFLPDLHVVGPVVQKGVDGEDGYSGFTVRHTESGETSPTGLAALLDEHGISTVVITGLATDYCVKETALDALRRGFATMVLEDAVRAIDLEPGDGARVLGELAQRGTEIRRS
jgi:nicotinamidase/pyrazinamidase